MKKKVKSQVLFFTLTAVFQTIILTVFIILYNKPIIVPIILGAAILVVWAVAVLKIIFVKMSLKDRK